MQSSFGHVEATPGHVGHAFRSKTDLVAEYLRIELQAGRPRAGERLVLSRVADTLGVSKIPVREAVTRLVGEGLLIVKPNVGPVVPEFTAHEVIETAMMRVALEGVAIDSAIPRHTDETLQRIEDLLQIMETADEEFPALNVQFHTLVVAPSPYAEMTRSITDLLKRAQRYSIVHSVPGYRPCAHREHLAIFDALTARDTERVRLLNEEHVMTAARQMVDQMDDRS